MCIAPFARQPVGGRLLHDPEHQEFHNEGPTMTDTLTRRRIIQIAPLAGVALLTACSPKAEAPAAPPAAPPPAPAPAPAAEPAPMAPAATSQTPAAGPLPALDEKDPLAVALAYVDDASRVDASKHKNYIAGSVCAGCALYQGKPEDAGGPCALFPGKQVAAKGWCSSWVKKA